MLCHERLGSGSTDPFNTIQKNQVMLGIIQADCCNDQHSHADAQQLFNNARSTRYFWVEN